MTSKIIVNNIEADLGVPYINFNSKISAPNVSITIGTRTTAAVLSTVGIGATILLRSGIGTIFF